MIILELGLVGSTSQTDIHVLQSVGPGSDVDGDDAPRNPLIVLCFCASGATEKEKKLLLPLNWHRQPSALRCPSVHHQGPKVQQHRLVFQTDAGQNRFSLSQLKLKKKQTHSLDGSERKASLRSLAFGIV